ncbi:MAG: flagellar motor protein MotB [Lachnospiraceae bacterium]|nr:flagellar motor protein MotB [Lachnospiraceae bacterium]
MAKKKQEDPPQGSPAWMATFSDLMNLLVCFFVLLFSMSSVDAAKYEQIVQSFSDTFSIFEGGGSSIGEEGVMISNGVSQLTDLSTFFSSMGMNDTGRPDNDVEAETPDDSNKEAGGKDGDSGETEGQIGEEGKEISAAEAKESLEEAQLKASEELAERIREMLEESGLAQEVDIDFTSQYVLLTMNGALLFDSGSATIREDAIPLVNKVGQILTRYASGTIEIEGHTDNVPVSGKGLFASNDELSGARALSVFRYLIDNTSLEPAKIKHSGRGEYLPVADNSTPEGRAKNRRVEVKVYNELSDSV